MSSKVEEGIRSARVVVLGLMAGLVCFAGVSLISKRLVGDILDPTLTWVLLALLGLCAVAVVVTYPSFERAALGRIRVRLETLRQASDPSALILADYRALTIQRAAMVEGLGFFAILVYMMTGYVFVLAVSALATAFLGLVVMPSRAAVEQLAAKAVRAS